MADFLASRPMESFFMNPTMKQDKSMENFARISIMSEPAPKTRFSEFPLSEGSKERKSRTVSTVQDLFLNNNFLASYHSDEESASPRNSSETLSLRSHDGDVSLGTPVLVGGEQEYQTERQDEEEEEEPRNKDKNEHEDEDEKPAMDLFLVPEELANSCTKIEHRCNRAQAIVLKPVGKPKMVLMPRLVDSPQLGQFKKVSTESFQPRPVRSKRISTENFKNVLAPQPDRLKRASGESFQNVLVTQAEQSKRVSSESSRNFLVPHPDRLKRVSGESFKHAFSASASNPRAESRRSLRLILPQRVSFSALPPLPASSVSQSSAEEASATSTSSPIPDPETPIEVEEKRAPSIPLMHAAKASDSFPRLSDIAAGNMAGGAVKRPLNTNGTNTPTSPMAPAKRQLRRIASTISNASDLVRRKSSISSLKRHATTTSMNPAPPRLSLVFDKDGPYTPMGPIPRRQSSMGRLTPRGPCERAPIIILPPFPDDEEEDDDFGDVSSDRDLPKWDVPRTRHVAKLQKARPSIDGVVAGNV